MAASIASLKGPKHGGANLKVQEMFADIKEHCSDWDNKEEICCYLNKILDKEAFDHAGLIYGMGHAVYTNSDPREVILKGFAKKLSDEKGMQNEYALYETVEKEAGQLIMCQCRFLQWFRIFYAWNTRRNVYTYVCNLTYIRLVRTPS